MPNDNIMGIPTRACINGLTKEDTDRLKDALIKKIENDETTVEITEDGKIIFADDNNLFLSFDGNILGITKDASGDYIPWTVPYLPEDENENPLVPPNDTIMTSANIGVDPRIVRTTGNQTISGIKTLTGVTVCSSTEIDLNNPPTYRVRGMNSLRVGTNNTQIVSEDNVWIATAGNSKRLTITCKDENGNDLTCALMMTVFRDGGSRLRFEKADGTYIDIVPRVQGD